MAEELKVVGVDPIPEGQKFVALYDDGSGCTLGVGRSKGLLRLANYHDMDDVTIFDQDWLQDAGYAYWLPLPDDFKLWFERKAERKT